MKVLRVVFKYIFICFCFFYLAFLFLLSPIINSNFSANYIEKFLSEKSNLQIKVEKLNLKTFWNLSFCVSPEIIIKSEYLNKPILIGKNGTIYFKHFKFFVDNLSVSFDTSSLFVNGVIGEENEPFNINISGDNLLISDIHSGLLYFQKFKSRGEKVFIENFKDFSGFIDVDLNYTKDGFFGTCLTKNLSAKTVLFNVPILFKEVIFYFQDKRVFAESNGVLGFEPVYAAFVLNDMGTSSQRVSGIVESKLTEKLVDAYVPDVKLVDSASASVAYVVKNKKIDVDYSLNLGVGSDIYYKNANLGLENFNRRLYVKTHKEFDELSIENYDYSLVDGQDITNIIIGNGLLKKEDGHYQLQYINCKTNGFAPVSVAGSFGEYVDGGFFDGDLKFDAKKNKVTGNFTVVESHYKDFYLEKALVNADDDNMQISANGTFDDFPFNWVVYAQNDFNNKINIYNMNLFLDEFIVRVGDYDIKTNRTSIPKPSKDIDITIHNWSIKLNKISHDRIVVENINLSGSLDKDIFNFVMKDVSFASGILSANGWYNFNNHSSDIYFSAHEINSNIVADTVFGLKNQISGLASACLHAQTADKLKNITANANFSIDDGYLPKLGDSEITLFKTFKFKLSDIVNMDIDNAESLSSDIKGEFNLNNYHMKDINLISKQKYLSMFVEGDYNIKEQDAYFNLFGKYSESMQKKVKIFFVPLNWITKFLFRSENSSDFYNEKIKNVPSISTDTADEQAFRVQIKGNINDNDFNIDLKRIN